MDFPLDLTLSPPTPSPKFHPAPPTTPTTTGGSVFHRLRLSTPLQNPKKKRSKLLCFDIQRDGDASSSSFTAAAAVKPKPAARKPDPSAPKITMPCSECGKKFWSWKALHGHMRCHPDRQWRGVHPPPNHLLEASSLTLEDYQAASCLLLLGNSRVMEPRSDERSIEAGHRCGICWKVFSSGQALGGHKRRHWERTATAASVDPCIGGGLDLNMPAQAVEQKNDLQLVLRLGIGD